MLADLYRAQFGQSDLSLFQSDVAVDAHGAVALPAAFSAFESGLARFFTGEEVPVGGIQVAQALLQSDTVDFLQEFLFFL